MRYTPQDQTLGPNYDVHDVLASVGLHDAVAVVAPGTRGPHGLTAAGTSGAGRVNRIYLDGPRAARAIPPEPRQ
jgi:hypothetical protein